MNAIESLLHTCDDLRNPIERFKCAKNVKKFCCREMFFLAAWWVAVDGRTDVADSELLRMRCASNCDGSKNSANRHSILMAEHGKWENARPTERNCILLKNQAPSPIHNPFVKTSAANGELRLEHIHSRFMLLNLWISNIRAPAV